MAIGYTCARFADGGARAMAAAAAEVLARAGRRLHRRLRLPRFGGGGGGELPPRRPRRAPQPPRRPRRPPRDGSRASPLDVSDFPPETRTRLAPRAAARREPGPQSAATQSHAEASLDRKSRRRLRRTRLSDARAAQDGPGAGATPESRTSDSDLARIGSGFVAESFSVVPVEFASERRSPPPPSVVSPPPPPPPPSVTWAAARASSRRDSSSARRGDRPPRKRRRRDSRRPGASRAPRDDPRVVAAPTRRPSTRRCVSGSPRRSNPRREDRRSRSRRRNQLLIRNARHPRVRDPTRTHATKPSDFVAGSVPFSASIFTFASAFASDATTRFVDSSSSPESSRTRFPSAFSLASRLLASSSARLCAASAAASAADLDFAFAFAASAIRLRSSARATRRASRAAAARFSSSSSAVSDAARLLDSRSANASAAAAHACSNIAAATIFEIAPAGVPRVRVFLSPRRVPRVYKRLGVANRVRDVARKRVHRRGRRWWFVVGRSKTTTTRQRVSRGVGDGGSKVQKPREHVALHALETGRERGEGTPTRARVVSRVVSRCRLAGSSLLASRHRSLARVPRESVASRVALRRCRRLAFLLGDATRRPRRRWTRAGASPRPRARRRRRGARTPRPPRVESRTVPRPRVVREGRFPRRFPGVNENVRFRKRRRLRRKSADGDRTRPRRRCDALRARVGRDGWTCAPCTRRATRRHARATFANLSCPRRWR